MAARIAGLRRALAQIEFPGIPRRLQLEILLKALRHSTFSTRIVSLTGESPVNPNHDLTGSRYTLQYKVDAGPRWGAFNDSWRLAACWSGGAVPELVPGSVEAVGDEGGHAHVHPTPSAVQDAHTESSGWDGRRTDLMFLPVRPQFLHHDYQVIKPMKLADCSQASFYPT
jgi:hypothetical protein